MHHFEPAWPRLRQAGPTTDRGPRRLGQRFTCQCPSFYTGSLCGERRDPCTTRPCRNGGTCQSRRGEVGVAASSSTSYLLHPLLLPPYCILFHVLPTASSSVSSLLATLSSSSSCLLQVSCSCPPGWQGRLCETNTDDCSSHSCQHGGVCRYWNSHQELCWVNLLAWRPTCLKFGHLESPNTLLSPDISIPSLT